MFYRRGEVDHIRLFGRFANGEMTIGSTGAPFSITYHVSQATADLIQGTYESTSLSDTGFFILYYTPTKVNTDGFK